MLLITVIIMIAATVISKSTPLAVGLSFLRMPNFFNYHKQEIKKISLKKLYKLAANKF